MNKCRKFFIIILLLIFFVLQGYSQSYQMSNTSGMASHINRIKSRGKIIIGMIRTDQYPFFYLNQDGELVGLDVDISKRIAQILNVDIEINRVADTFNDLIPLIKNEEIDIAISKMSRTIGRSQEIIFSIPYVVFRQSLLLDRIQLAKVSSNDLELIEVIRNFSGNIGVIKDSSYERYAKVNFPMSNIVSFNTWAEVLQALNKSEVLGVYRDELEIEIYSRSNPQLSLYIKQVLIKDRKDPIAIGMPAKSTHLAYFINFVLNEMKDEDFPKTVKEILQVYKR